MDLNKITRGLFKAFDKDNINEVKDDNIEIIYSPMKGRVLSITEVPDPVFSEKMMGDGAAIDPEDNVITSPVDGEIVVLFDTKHAIAIKTKSGVDLLLHIGLDTVELGGEGFTAFVKEGDKVKVGQKLLEVDFELVRRKVKSAVTPIIVSNLADFVSIETSGSCSINHRDELFRVILK